jgi:predicted permease
MTSFRNDLRLARRMLVKSPLFTGIVVVTMAIAIGLNTAVFAAVEAMLLRPLPGVTAPDRLVQLYRTAPEMEWGSNSIPHYSDLRERTKSVFSDVALWNFVTLSITADGRAQRIFGQMASANYFKTLGAKPQRGRFFAPEEDEGRGAHPVIVLSDGGWHSLFGGDPKVVGKTVNLNGRAVEVIGIAEPDTRGVMPMVEPALWIPLMQLEQAQPGSERMWEQRGNNSFNVIARLAPGVTIEQAKARLKTLDGELKALYPDEYKDRGIRLYKQSEAGMHPSVRGAQVGLSAVVMAVVTILLLVACVNVSNLFLARARDRAREMAIRLALGATRRQLLRQLLTESLLFAVVSGAAGLLVAAIAIALANQISLPIDIGFRPDLKMSPMVLGFTLLVSTAAGVIFGLAPALQATRPSLVPALKGEAPAGDSRSRVRHGLIIAQMALSIILLTCAGLFIGNLRAATKVDMGLNPEGAVTAGMDPALQGYDRARTDEFWRRLLERLRAMPGVQSVGLIDHLPLNLNESDRGVEIPGYVPREGEGMSIQYAAISPSYLSAVGARLVAGRDFEARDDSAAAPVLIVNQRFVDRFWPGQDAIGKTVHTGGKDRTIVGVVATGRYFSLGEKPTAFMFGPQSQMWNAEMAVVMRGTASPSTMLSNIRAEVKALDADMPLVNVRTLEDHLGTALLPARLAGTVLGLFGVIGLLLAAVGMYGVMAHSVTQRTREIGIRMALGASSARVVKLVMGQGMRHVAIGAVIGLVGAFGAFRLIRGVLYGSSSLPPEVFIGAPLMLLAVASLAILFPARRAAALDPQVALRQE